MGANSMGIRDREGLQDATLRDSLTVSQWQYIAINPGKTYQCGGVLGKGSFGKVVLDGASSES
jgi:hypothetical protein